MRCRWACHARSQICIMRSCMHDGCEQIKHPQCLWQVTSDTSSEKLLTNQTRNCRFSSSNKTILKHAGQSARAEWAPEPREVRPVTQHFLQSCTANISRSACCWRYDAHLRPLPHALDDLDELVKLQCLDWIFKACHAGQAAGMLVPRHSSPHRELSCCSSLRRGYNA